MNTINYHVILTSGRNKQISARKVGNQWHLFDVTNGEPRGYFATCHSEGQILGKISQNFGPISGQEICPVTPNIWARIWGNLKNNWLNYLLVTLAIILLISLLIGGSRRNPAPTATTAITIEKICNYRIIGGVAPPANKVAPCNGFQGRISLVQDSLTMIAINPGHFIEVEYSTKVGGFHLEYEGETLYRRFVEGVVAEDQVGSLGKKLTAPKGNSSRGTAIAVYHNISRNAIRAQFSRSR